MPQKIEIPSEKMLVAAFKSGDLTKNIFDSFGNFRGVELDAIQDMCVKLHNTGKINLLSLTKTADFENLEGPYFFTGQHFFCNVIPKLKAPISEMMQCVQTLVEKGGNDGAANIPNGAFLEWCQADLARSQEVVDFAKNDNPLAIHFLTFALTAGNMFKEAKSFMEKCKDEKRLSSITALGRMNFNTPAQAREALNVLLNTFDDEPNDQLYANILGAALEIVAKTEQIAGDEALPIVKRVCEAPGTDTIHYCAHALWRFGNSMSEDMVILLLGSLRKLDPANKGTVREFDEGLRKLLDTPNADLAITCLKEILISSGNTLTLSEFPSFCRTLIAGPEDKFNKVLVAWMLSGDWVLCDGLNKALLHSRDLSERAVNLPIKDFDLSASKQLFLCRKAVGYFFLQPVFAGSILVSVLRVCDDNGADGAALADDVRNLLFTPLLQSYGRTLRDYLETIKADDSAHPHIQLALKKADQYLDGLKTIDEIKELHPSEHERQLERLRNHDLMLVAYKKAQNKSPLLSLVKHSTLLYGSKSISYVDGPEGGRRPVEMDLQAHSVSVELPRYDIIDPNGLASMLLVFKCERLKS